MVTVISESAIQEKMNQAVPSMASRYTTGVNSASWNAPSLAGQSLYEAAMSDPAILARRSSGIAKVSDTQWKADTVSKGASIIGARFKIAIPKQIANYRPFRVALEALVLPPRTTDPLLNLTQRAGAVVSKMVETKAAQG